MDWYRQHLESLDINGAQAEKNGMDIGGLVTGVKDQDGVVCDDGGGVHILAKVDVS